MDDPAAHDDSLQPEPSDEGFVDVDPSAPRDPSEDSTPIVDDLQNYTKRELRPPRRGLQPTTWLDNDETGNYDPAEERMKRRFRPRPQQRIRAPGDQTRERIPIEKPKLDVSVTFTSEGAKKSFNEIISQIQELDVADQEGYKLRTRAQDEEIGSPTTEIDLTAKPFARGCWGCAALAGDGQSQCSLLVDERYWPCLTCEEDDCDCELIAPPVRKRQCELCKRRKVPCSYTYTRNHGATCSQCESVSQPCIAGPVTQFIKQRIRLDRDWEKDPLPTKKKGKFRANEECWECSQAGTSCSYGSDDDGTPCEACRQNGNPCTIGKRPPPQPTKSKKRKRVTEQESDPANAETETPTTESQDSKAEEEKEETVKDDRRDSAAELPTTLRMPNTCNPHAIAAAKKKEQDIETPTTSSRVNSTYPRPRQPPIPAPPRLPRYPRGRPIFRKIATSFCHPIHFNCDKSPERGANGNNTSTSPSKPCSFCTAPLTSFHGLGHKPNVEVIDYQNNEPYTETRNGHKALGRESTRLCAQCTTDRLNILFCDHHRMRPIPGTDYTDEELDDAMDDILEGLEPKDIKAYCNLCGHLAQYKCRNKREPCGLALCVGCKETLVETHGSDLQHMLSHSKHQPTRSAPLGLRADAELLDKERGALARFFLMSLRN